MQLCRNGRSSTPQAVRPARKIAASRDGSAKFIKALGLETDLTERGMGMRSQRDSMLVDDGVVSKLNVEKPGQYEVSSAHYMLKQV